MLTTTIVVLAFAAAPAPPVTHEVWEADIAPAGVSSIYLLQFDEQLAEAAKGLGPEWVEVIDAKGRTMPHGFWESTGEGPHEDVVLALTYKREQRVQPQLCQQPKPPPECTAFNRGPDFIASPITMAQRLTSLPLELTSSPNSNSVMSSMSFHVAGRASVNQAVIPLRYDVVDTAMPGANVADWAGRSLVLGWKSHLPPIAIAWQIGHNVAKVTPGDRALLNEDGVSLGDWNQRLRSIWRDTGRMLVFSTLNATQNDDGSWQADVPLKGLVGDASLQIASAPADAVDLVDVRLKGIAPLTSPQLVDIVRSMRLLPLDEGRWKVTDPWPKHVASARILFTFEQSLEITDNRIKKIDYQTKSASGRVETTSIQPFQTFASANALNGIGADLPINAADPWVELQQLNPMPPLPPPQLTAVYHTRALWFENVGTPPYRLQVGAKSARRPDQMSAADSELVGMGNTRPAATILLPMAALQNVRKTQMYTETATASSTQQVQASGDSRIAAFIAMIAVLAFAALAVIDDSVRRKIGAPRGDSQ